MADPHEHVVSRGLYALILVALMVLLALTTIMGFVNVDQILPGHRGWNTGIALTIAIVKALLVVLFFMHVKYGSRLTWVFAAAGFVWLAIMIVLMMSDYATRNRPEGVNPKGEPRYLHSTPSDSNARVIDRPGAEEG